MVTGAARGQGAAEALRLLRAGAIVHALDVLPADDPTWDALRAEAGADAGRLRIRVADVASEAGWRTLAAQIERGRAAVRAGQQRGRDPAQDRDRNLAC